MKRAVTSPSRHGMQKKASGVHLIMERAERMIAQGLMTEHGQRVIAIAKELGRWG